MKTRYVSIGHRIQALVLAVVMVFTSLNISSQGHAEERWTPSNSIILETEEYVSVAFELTSYSRINGIEFDIATIEGSAFIKASIVNTDTNKTVWETNPNIEISHTKAMNEWDIHNVPIALNKEVKAGNYAIIIENTSSARAIIKYDGTVNTGNEVTGSSIGGGNYGKCISVNTSTIAPTEYRLTSEDYSSIEITGEATIAINVTNSSQTVALSLGGMHDEDDSITFASDLPCSIMSTSRTSANITISTSGKYTITATTNDGGKAIFYIYALRAEDASAKTYNGTEQAPSGFAIKAGDTAYSIDYSRADGVLKNPVNAGTYKYSLSLASGAITGVSGFSAEANFVINKATLGSASVDDITYEGGVYIYDNLRVFDANSAEVDSYKYLVDSVSEALSSDGVTIDYTINIVANDSNYEGATSVTKTLPSAGQTSGTGHVIDLSLLTAEVTDGNLIYNGTDNPGAAVVLKNGGSTIESTVIDIANDCNISYRFDDEKLNVGNVTITVSPKENSTKLKGYTTARAYVNPLDIGTINLTVTGSSVNATNKTISQQKYDAGNAIVFGTDLKLIHGSKELIEGTDYQLVYSNNTEVSSVSGEPASLTIKGIGNYRGQVTYKYDIVGTFKDRVSLQYTVDGTTYRADASGGYKLRNYNPVYNGSDITLGSYNLFVDNEYISPAAYTVTYSSDHKNAGEASIIFTLNNSAEAEAIKNKYYATSQADATIDFKFTIQQKLISSDSITVTIPNKKYNGSEQEILLARSGDIVVKDGATVLDGASITVESYKGKNVGSNYDVIIRARADGNYRGVRTEKWAIEKLDISKPESNVTVADIGQVEYTGDRQDIARLMLGKVKINGTVIESTNNYKYIIYNSNNIIVNQATEIGTYKIEITAEDDGNLTGTAIQRAALEITPKKMNLIVKYKGNTLGYITGSDKDVIIPSTTKTWDYTGSRVLLKTSDFTVIDSKTNTELVRDKEWDFVTPSDSSINVTRVPSDTYTTIRIKKANIYDNSAERVKVHFTISSRSVANVTVEDQNDWVKIGDKNYPKLLVKYTNSDAIFKDTTELVFGTDYDLVEIDGTDLTTAGKGKRVKIVGKGNYTGEKIVTQSFTKGDDLSDGKTEITVSPVYKTHDPVNLQSWPGKLKWYDVEYNNSKPNITVTRNGEDITSKVDIKYRKDVDHASDIDSADDYLKKYSGDLDYIIVEVVPKDGTADYYIDGDPVAITYRIVKKNGTSGNLKFSAGFNKAFDDLDVDYNRGSQRIYYKLELENPDHTYTTIDHTNYTVTVKRVKGEKEDVVATSTGLKDGEVAYLTIPKEKANANSDASDDYYEVCVSVTNSSSVYLGLETAKSVSGLKINKGKISKVEDIDEVPYTGYEVKPDFKNKVKDGNDNILIYGEDYTVEWLRNKEIESKDAGADVAPKATIKGINNYEGEVIKYFTIAAKALNNEEFEIIIGDEPYPFKGGDTGENGVKIPDGDLTVINTKTGATLVKDRDYTVSYSLNVSPGNATVTIKGEGSYKEEISTNFKIMLDINRATLAKEINTENGKYLKPGSDSENPSDWLDLNKKTVYLVCTTIDSDVRASSDGVEPKEFTVYYYDGEQWKPKSNCIANLTEAFSKITYPDSHTITLKGNTNNNVMGEKEITVKATGKLSDVAIKFANDKDYVYWNGHVDENGGKNVPGVSIWYNDENISDLWNIKAAFDAYQNTDGGEVGLQSVDVYPTAVGAQYFGAGSYVTVNFRVVYNISQAEFDDIPAKLYTGDEITPTFSLKVSANGLERPITEDKINWAYSNNIRVSDEKAKAKITMTGDLDKYTDGTKEAEFEIKGVNISDRLNNAQITLIDDAAVEYLAVYDSDDDVYKTEYKPKYNGQKQRPTVKLVVNSIELKQNVDYIVDYKNSTDASTRDDRAKIIIDGLPGSGYTGTIVASFFIEKRPLSETNIRFEKPSTAYKYEGGVDNTADPVVDNRIDPKLIDNYSVYYLVSGEEVFVNSNEYETPVYSEGDKSYGENCATVTITAKADGNYSGSKVQSYTINQTDISKDEMIEITSSTMEFTGQKQQPKIEITLKPVNGTSTYVLKQGVDYRIEPSYVTAEKGEKEIEIIGLGGFTGRRPETVTITKRKISNEAITKSYTAEQDYTGSSVMPTNLSLKDTGIGDYQLVEGRDYKVEAYNNTKSGAAYSSEAMLVEPPSGPYMKVTALEDGDYEGVVYLPFSIGKAIDGTSSFTLSPESGDYTGYKQTNIGYTVNINGHVANSREYTIEIYKGDDRVAGVELERVTEIKDAGVYTIKAIPTGEYYGELKAYYEVKRREPTEAQITIELPTEMKNKLKNRYETKYTGSEIRPSVKVYDNRLTGADERGLLVPESEYEVRYSNNKNVSLETTVAAVEIVFLNKNYADESARHFTQNFYIIESDAADIDVVIAGNGKIYYDATGDNLRTWDNVKAWEADNLTVKYNGTVLESTEYSISYEFSGEDKAVPCIGPIKLIIDGNGNFTGTKEVVGSVGMYALIEDANNTELFDTVTFGAEQITFAGHEYRITKELKSHQYGDASSKEPVVPSIPTLQLGGKTIYETDDYVYKTEVHRKNGADYGYGYVVITPKSEYIEGSCLVVGYWIDTEVGSLVFKLVDSVGKDFELSRTWTGLEQKPGYVILTPSGDKLVENGVIIDTDIIDSVGQVIFEKDGEIITSNVGLNPGMYNVRVRVVPKTGSPEPMEEQFTVVGIDLGNLPENALTVIDGSIYQGEPQKPKVFLKVNGNLVSADEYNVVYENNIGPNGNMDLNGNIYPEDVVPRGKVTVRPKDPSNSALTGEAVAYFNIKVQKPSIKEINVTSSKAVISWQKVAAELSGDSVSYVAVVEKADKTERKLKTVTNGLNIVTFEGLDPRQDYIVNVYTVMNRPKNVGSGTLNFYSDPTTKGFKTDVAHNVSGSSVTPQGGSATSGTAKLTWTNMDPNPYWCYNIYRSTTKDGKYELIASVPADKKEYQNKNLEKGKTYYYMMEGVEYNPDTRVFTPDTANRSKPVAITIQ